MTSARDKLAREYSHQEFKVPETANAVSRGVSRAIDPRNLAVPIAEVGDMALDSLAGLINMSGRSKLARGHIPGGLAAMAKARTAPARQQTEMTEPSSMTEEMVATLANPGSYLNWVGGLRAIPKALKHGVDAYRKAEKTYTNSWDGLESFVKEKYPSVYDQYFGGEQIIQIKGKQNRKPNDEYLPFVQDFVRNPPTGGKWAGVKELENAGLVTHPTTGEFMTQAEYDAARAAAEAARKDNGFAGGGKVDWKDLTPTSGGVRGNTAEAPQEPRRWGIFTLTD